MADQPQAVTSARRKSNSPESLKKRSQRTRRTILEGSAAVFSSMPYEAVRIHDLLNEDGVTQGGLYHHFPGAKEEIAREIIHEMLREQVRIAESTVGDDGIKSVVAISRRIVDALSNSTIMRAGWRLSTYNEGKFGDTAAPGNGLEVVLTNCLKKAQANGDIRDSISIQEAVEGFYSIFIGTQVASFLRSEWEDLPQSIRRIEPFAIGAIARDEYLRAANYIGQPGYPM